MKRFWLVLLSAALVLAFAMSASAQTTVRFSGSYYAQGQYFDNHELQKNNTVSTAFVGQRFRLTTDFTIAQGVTFTTRADIHERMWGSRRSAYSQAVADWRNTPYAVEDENIGMDFAFVSFNTKVGRFQVGYQAAGAWGTAFGNNGTAHARLAYIVPRGPWTFSAIWEKQREGEIIPNQTSGYANPGSAPVTTETVPNPLPVVGATAPVTRTVNGGDFTRSDADRDFYYLSATNRWKTGEAGLLFTYNYDAQGATGAANTFRSNQYFLTPYARASFGKLSVEAELTMGFGKAAEFIRPATPAATPDQDNAGLAYYASVRYAMGPLTVGALYGFAQGDDPATLNKNEGTATAGWDFKPTLLLFNQGTVYKWAGEMGRRGAGQYRVNDTMTNASIWQLNLGYAVSKDLALFTSYSQANVNQKNIAGIGVLVSDDIGREFDVTATYRIMGNLEYVLGFAYFWAGDAFKGANAATQIGNNYLVHHRLNLTF